MSACGTWSGNGKFRAGLLLDNGQPAPYLSWTFGRGTEGLPTIHPEHHKAPCSGLKCVTRLFSISEIPLADCHDRRTIDRNTESRMEVLFPEVCSRTTWSPDFVRSLNRNAALSLDRLERRAAPGSRMQFPLPSQAAGYPPAARLGRVHCRQPNVQQFCSIPR
jgi:hypothetical protein